VSERRPVVGWRDDNGRGSQWSLDLGLVTARVYVYRYDSVWRLRDGDDWTTIKGDADGRLCRIAAEDAADALLCAGLRALGRVP